MGGVNSICIPKNRNPDPCRENHSVKVKRHTRNFSATFHMTKLSEEPDVERVNINTATEEELMTLPGINRIVAQNIVQYRDAIGHFKQVEDLALVSGVGATRLRLFQSEVTVRQPGGTGPTPCSPTLSGTRTVCVNDANVFQLMKARAMTQQLAENIVSYRDKRGPFTSLEQLLKVKGISRAVFGAIQLDLTLEQPTVSQTPAVAHSATVSRDTTQTTAQSTANHTTILSAGSSLSYEPYLNELTQRLRGLVETYRRPRDTEDELIGRIRVATWHLDISDEMLRNPAAIEVIGRTLLENSISVLVINGTSTQSALKQLCIGLNEPGESRPLLLNWSGSRGRWSSQSAKTRSAILFDESRVKLIRSAHASTEQTVSGDTPTTNEAVFSSTFKVDDLEFTVIPQLVEFPKEPVAGNVMACCTGEAIALPDAVEVLKLDDESRLYVNQRLNRFFTGRSACVTSGLTHPLICDMWAWNGAVSLNVPCWVELHTAIQQNGRDSLESL